VCVRPLSPETVHALIELHDPARSTIATRQLVVWDHNEARKEHTMTTKRIVPEGWTEASWGEVLDAYAGSHTAVRVYG